MKATWLKSHRFASGEHDFFHGPHAHHPLGHADGMQLDCLSIRRRYGNQSVVHGGGEAKISRRGGGAGGRGARKPGCHRHMTGYDGLWRMAVTVPPSAARCEAKKEEG